jgi:K+-transporting ATPase ATPase A chain
MNTLDLIQIVLFIVAIVALTPVLGSYMARIFSGERTLLHPLLNRPEQWIYKISGIDQQAETDWKTYAISLLIFNILGLLFLFFVQLFQNWLPVNPARLPDVKWHTALNTAISFMTNTNWQSYAGETTMSYLTQMIGLTAQNFLSAATGIAVLVAVIRGLSRKSTDKIGNFWVDLTRSTLYILLPLSFLFAILFTGQGVIQNFHSNISAQTLEGAQQTIPMGPVSSQIAIKQLGTNGGGFFNVNSSHPFENPTPLSNFLEMFAILIIPASLTYTYGKMIGSRRQGWTIFIVMMMMLLAGLSISLFSENTLNPVSGIHSLMEGKEQRFGITNSVLWSTVTTAASNGSVNAMHDSLSAVSGMIALVNIMLGEVIFGGVGAGLYGMIVFIFLTVFIAGLMVGRSPEYLGKKIEAFDVQMAILAALAPGFVILLFSAVASSTVQGLSGLGNSGPHGLSEILYAFSSAAGNNGSAFAGLNSNTVFYNLTLGAGMLIGRFLVIIPVLAIAGSMAGKKITPVSAGTFRTDTMLFAGLLIAVILIVGGLTFFPALALGPVMEHFLMKAGIVF